MPPDDLITRTLENEKRCKEHPMASIRLVEELSDAAPLLARNLKLALEALEKIQQVSHSYRHNSIAHNVNFEEACEALATIKKEIQDA